MAIFMQSAIPRDRYDFNRIEDTAFLKSGVRSLAARAGEGEKGGGGKEGGGVPPYMGYVDMSGVWFLSSFGLN